MEMNSSKINTFIFDCFGVVCEDDLHNWIKKNESDGVILKINRSELFKEFDLGKISENDLLDYFINKENVNLTREKLQEELDGYLNLDIKLTDIIIKLKNKGFKIVLLSNANASFFERKIYPTYPNFKDLFNEIIISSEIGMVKPNKDIYLYTFEKINSKPEESLFIDDSKINVDGALNVGMQGFLYTDVDSFVEYIKSLGIDL